MRRRYGFLQQSDVFGALNKVRDALLAARGIRKDEEIIRATGSTIGEKVAETL